MNTISSNRPGIPPPHLSFATGAAFLVMALAIFAGWQTPAICYQLTSAFGAVFIVNGLLGITKFGNTRLWRYLSYTLGMLITLFAFASLYRQLSLGERGQLMGFTYYSICGSLLLIGVISVTYLNVSRKGFAALDTGRSK
jgi:hypothetical protein